MRLGAGAGSHRKLAHGLALAMIVAALCSAAWAAAAAKSKASADSTREAKSIRIDREGIHIDAAGGHVKGLVKISDGNVHVTADGDTEVVRRRVHVSGPVVVVDDSNAGLVRVFADAEVAEGERIEGGVVAVFGSVEVSGHVAGDVAAVFGSVTLRPGAVVDGDVVAIGGVLDQAVGATVNGESVSLGLFSWHPGVPTLPVLLGSLFCAWLITLFLGWLLALVFPQRLRRVALTASQRTGGSFVIGVASGPLVVIAIVLLLITVVGIPFAIVLPLFYIFIAWAGQLAAACVLGCRVLRRPIAAGGPMAPLAAGTLFVAAFFALAAILSGPEGASRTFALFFTLLGTLLVLGLSVVGTGAVLLSRFGSRPRETLFDAPGAGAPVRTGMTPPMPATPPGI